jgi:AraC family transcriptional regulator
MTTACSSENLSTPIVVDGSRQAPRNSSVSRGWKGIVLETYACWRGRTVAAYPFHVISLQLCGHRFVFQRRNGRALRQETRAGNIIITPMGPEKEWDNDDRSDGEFIVANLSPSLFATILTDHDIANPQGVELLDNFGTRDARVESLMLRLLDEFRMDEFANGIYVEALANQLVIQLLRRHSTLRAVTEPHPQRLSRPKLQRATEYIDSHLCEDLTVGAIARALSMSSSHFARAFKHTTGLAPHHYVLERRIERAKVLLRETDHSIAEVANQVGFSAASHFSVAFQRWVGLVPRQYRQDA